MYNVFVRIIGKDVYIMKTNSLEKDYAVFMYNTHWLRRQYSLSKRKMAKIMGIGIASLNKMERGDFPPRLKINTILDVCRYFHIKPADILTKRLGPTMPGETDGDE